MASYHGPKARVQRRFGEVLIPRAKYQKIMDKRSYPPGDHGKEKQYRSGRRSDYGLQLNEKQKLSFIYNIRERQMRRYFLRAKQQPGETGPNLLSLLERRLDNLVYRAGFAATIWAARQLVNHGHITVDGERVDLASYSVRSGEAVSLTDKMKKNVHILSWVGEGGAPPDYLAVNRESITVTLLRVPERRDIPVPVDEQLVVEFYTRLT
ncbi:MAG: 30S ribosomal protein S4 [Burkholderiales bacterium]|nr:30S ribosomal protein S4 [Anaerolineae bacterium]